MAAGLTAILGAICLSSLQPVSAATQSARLDSPSILRQRAFQSAMKHSQRSEDISKTISLYQAAIERSELDYGPDSTFTAQLYYELGSFALDNSKFTVAFDNLSRSVKLNPNSTVACLKLAEILNLRKDVKAARLQIEQLLAKHPDCKEARQILVSAIQRTNPAEATRQAFQTDRTAAMVYDSRNRAATARAHLDPQESIGSEQEIRPEQSDLTSEEAKIGDVRRVDRKQGTESSAKPERSVVMSVRLPRAKAADVHQGSNIPAQVDITPTSATVNREDKSAKKAKSAHLRKVSASDSVAEAAKLALPVSNKKARHDKLSRHAASATKSLVKIPKGLVPPPPPTPLLPGYAGLVPQAANPGLLSPRLRTEAKVRKSTAPKPEDNEEGSESGNSKAAKTVNGASKPSQSNSTAAGTKNGTEQDGDFLLDWASVHKKNKK
jgi:tetratricopeptide (TPR) repeat protein